MIEVLNDKLLNRTETAENAKGEEFRMLEGKLLELESEFDGRVKGLHAEVLDKTNLIRALQLDLAKRDRDAEVMRRDYEEEIIKARSDNGNSNSYKGQS